MGSFTDFVGDQLNDMRAHSAERAMAENEIKLRKEQAELDLKLRKEQAELDLKLRKEQAELEKQAVLERLKIERAGSSRERNITVFKKSKEDLNELIAKAKPKVLEIRQLPLPKDEFECESMLEEAKLGMGTEQIEYVMEPPTMEDEGGENSPLESQIYNIDWNKGSTMICEAWKSRYDKLAEIAKSKYPDTEFAKKIFADDKKNLIKKILGYTALAICVCIGCFLLFKFYYFIYKLIF